MNKQIVSFHCVLKNKLGKLISSTYNRDVLTHDEKHQEGLVELARGLQNLTKGEKRQISLSAEQAYGFYDTKKVLEITKYDYSGTKNLRVGDRVKYQVEDEPQMFRVTNIEGEVITLDANHPLAGQDLVFEIEATDVRDATPEEISECDDDDVNLDLH